MICSFLKKYSKFKIFIFSSCAGKGSQLIQIESIDELNFLSDILLYSTASFLPLKNGWMAGIFTNPNLLFTTASAAEIL
jgi:hypothetical protein